MIAAYITLTSNVTAAAIQDASLRSQIDTTRQLIVINTKMVEILQAAIAKGYASGLIWPRRNRNWRKTAAALPPLLKQASQQHDLLAALTGRYSRARRTRRSNFRP